MYNGIKQTQHNIIMSVFVIIIGIIGLFIGAATGVWLIGAHYFYMCNVMLGCSIIAGQVGYDDDWREISKK